MNILIIIESGIIGIDISNQLKKHGLNPVWINKLEGSSEYIKKNNPDLIITQINSDLVDLLQKELISVNTPILFLNDSIKTKFNLDLIKSKWDLLPIPFDNKQLKEKLNNLLDKRKQ